MAVTAANSDEAVTIVMLQHRQERQDLSGWLSGVASEDQSYALAVHVDTTSMQLRHRPVNESTAAVLG